MLKFIFWSLLAGNALLWLLGSGHLGNLDGNVRQPARMQDQLNAEHIALIAKPMPAPIPMQAKVPEMLACIEIGNFTLPEAGRFEAQLVTLALGERQSRHNVISAEVASYMVHIPPQSGKEGAERKAAELQRMGIQNYFIMADSATQRWAISLGVFKSEAAAQNLLASLVKRGVRSARIAPRMVGSKLLTFRLRGLDPQAKSNLDVIKTKFPAQFIRSCQ